jgi:hypothetical protein
LAVDLVWSGVIYGLMDALLLSILPVLATWRAFTLLNWTVNWPGKILVGALAVFASLLVTVAYHLGYPEYRSAGVFGPAFGNTAMTFGYLITNNPLAAILSHIAMHIAGVLHGPASVIQLPPADLGLSYAQDIAARRRAYVGRRVSLRPDLHRF